MYDDTLKHFCIINTLIYSHLSSRIFPLGCSCVMVDKVDSSIAFHSFLYKGIQVKQYLHFFVTLTL